MDLLNISGDDDIVTIVQQTNKPKNKVFNDPKQIRFIAKLKIESKDVQQGRIFTENRIKNIKFYDNNNT